MAIIKTIITAVGSMTLVVIIYHYYIAPIKVVYVWISPDCMLAYEQSFGLFHDIPTETWKQMQHRVKTQPNHVLSRSEAIQTNKYQNEPAIWYVENIDPNFTCQNEFRLGRGDGGKWVCNPQGISRQAANRGGEKQKRNKCLVYSVGCNGNFIFETRVAKLLPSCEIHIFDIDDYTEAAKKEKHNFYFHHWGLKKDDEDSVLNKNKKETRLKGLRETLFTLGHTNRVIDIFKIDCEGCEWQIYKDMLSDDVDLRQILMEVHGVPPDIVEFFEAFQKANYVVFHKEPNVIGRGRAVEYAFLKLNQTFFTTQ